MKTIVAVLSFFSLSSSVTAQQIELYGGVNRQTYYEYTSIEPNEVIHGGIIGFGYSPIILDNYELRITGSLNSYHGTIGWASRYSSTAHNIKNYDFGIGVYPVNVVIIKHIHLNVGAELKFLIIDQSSGYGQSSSPGSPNWITTDLGRDIFPALNLGGIGRIGYEIKITDSVSLLPQYSVYVDLTAVFKNGTTRSLRQYFCLGVLHTLK